MPNIGLNKVREVVSNIIELHSNTENKVGLIITHRDLVQTTGHRVMAPMYMEEYIQKLQDEFIKRNYLLIDIRVDRYLVIQYELPKLANCKTVSKSFINEFFPMEPLPPEDDDE